ncbi:solute carrier family 40 member 3, chloroplastic-like isoform X1 [Panicum virgatum]|uniref:solute carrier family 40 member 3, chloroplastic-like isoform X1 n=1 Tax=Panicum virgatum TaxID=38727 RepID=UPI0019D56432|nr:solute carrier family 40 member 3, chloroplastic-like isoform X1 [Panicum virgatum]
MAASVSKLLAPPRSRHAATSRRFLPPRTSSARSPAGRRVAAPPSSLVPARRVTASCASADRAGSTGTDLAAATEEEELDDGLPFVQLSSDILRTELSLLKDGAPAAGSSLLAALPRRDADGDRLLGETAAYPAAMTALYAACLAGNATEQLWNFTWPAAMAALHPSLLPVAVLGFFTKLVVFAAGPLVGELISSLPRIPAYRYLTVIQAAAHWVSAAMIAYAFTLPRASTAPALLLQPWFAALVASTAVDRLSCVSLGVIAERDFVVQLAGEGRPVALARANATLSRVELLCEVRTGDHCKLLRSRSVTMPCNLRVLSCVQTAGASIFAVLLSRNDPLTCIRLSCAVSLCALPLLLFLGGAMNRLADGIFDHSAGLGSLQRSEHGSTHTTSAFSIRKKAEEAWATIKHGWTEYLRQPVLPASLAYVLVCFNVALAPGALMTTFLIHHGVSASVLGVFGGSSALMGILATFVVPKLVKELGILKAGAAGLVAQSALLGAAVLVFLTGPVSRQGGLFVFLGLIVASRLGHMAYSVVSLQVVQTGNPVGKAKLIGATEIAVASLAELAMMAVAMVTKDAAHFGWLAALSAASVTVAASLFCAWLANPTDELKRLFPC